MCELAKLPNKLWIAAFHLSHDGYLVTIRARGKFYKGHNFIGLPRQIKKKLLWKNAKAGKLGVNYKIWPWHKKAMAHFRIIICRLNEKTFSRLRSCNNQA